MNLAFVLCLVSAIYMCGVIWIIQLHHYPSFKRIAPEKFTQFHSRHTMAMGFVAGPAMVIELISAFWLLTHTADVFSITHLTFVALLWVSTFLISVPLHNQLAAAHDVKVIQKLIITNWPRTVLWTAKALLTFFWALKILKV